MKLTKEKILVFLNENFALLNNRFGVTNLALFGSFAGGEETEKSDIDLLVEMNEPSYDKLAGLKIFLEDIFEREVNVVRKHSRLKQRFLNVINRDLINVS